MGRIRSRRRHRSRRRRGPHYPMQVPTAIFAIERDTQTVWCGCPGCCGCRGWNSGGNEVKEPMKSQLPPELIDLYTPAEWENFMNEMNKLLHSKETLSR